jgi:hypothetical protein
MPIVPYEGKTKPLVNDLGDGTHRPVVEVGAGGSGGGGGSSDTTEATQLLVLGELQQIEAKSPPLVGGRVPVDPANVSNKLRVSCEANPTADANFTVVPGSGDLIISDGNTASASYWVISKDPFATGTESTITTVPTWGMPFEASIQLSLSQRTLGQEFSVESVSDEAALTAPADLAVSSIQQATTTLTVNTTLPHGLNPGMRFGVRDCADSRMNYPALVVATTPSPNQFTATAGPNGNLPSVTAGPFTSGFIYVRPALGFAKNGTSMIFENGAVGNASFYVRSDAGDVLPSATIAGNHSFAVSSTASVQAVVSPLAYSFQPSSEFRVTQEIDRVQWADVGVDSLNAYSARIKRTQVVPDIAKAYRMRIRARNNASLTRAVAHINSVTKTGTTTARVVTQAPHGLTNGDQIAAYGVRDQVNFANLTAATAITVVDANTFDVVWGPAVSASSQAGIIYRVNGGNLPSALGAIAQVVQSVTRTNNVLTLVGSAAWAGVSIGDYVNLAALHNTAGVDLLLDGPYRIRNISTTTLEVEPIGNAPTGANIALTNCGGAVVKRTDLRIHNIRVLDFERQRVELTPRPSADNSGSSLAISNGSINISSGTVTTVSTLTGGAAAEDAATTANPHIIGGVVRTATSPTTLIAGDAARVTMTSSAAQVMYPFAVPEAGFQYTGVLTTTAAQTVRVAGAAGIRNYVTSLQYQNTGATATTVLILDNATVIAQFNAPANMALPASVQFAMPIRGTAATALNVNCGTAGANVQVNVQGFQAA